jgi:hypothetical protein
MAVKKATAKKAPAKKATRSEVKKTAIKKVTPAAKKTVAAPVKVKPGEEKKKPAEIKTKENDASVEDFINSMDSEQKRKDSFIILEMMKKATKEEPKMWGSSIIGFGNVRYKSPATGREVDWMKIGFSPRKANLSVYLTMNVQEQAAALKKLGKHKTGVGCLYINKLADIDVKVLKEMIDAALKRK